MPGEGVLGMGREEMVAWNREESRASKSWGYRTLVQPLSSDEDPVAREQSQLSKVNVYTGR